MWGELGPTKCKSLELSLFWCKTSKELPFQCCKIKWWQVGLGHFLAMSKINLFFLFFQEDFPHRGVPQVEHLKLGGKTLEQCYTPVLRCGLC